MTQFHGTKSYYFGSMSAPIKASDEYCLKTKRITRSSARVGLDRTQASASIIPVPDWERRSIWAAKLNPIIGLITCEKTAH